ncbi:MAG: hypothetical protein C4527_05050 [Candidatus Omnitrophota bacterium]|jgi:uncharacterized SAM-binding protein YcdF (DUF218 family)|nr:MAG: hypothetical protein C4527_05050 [Candidatus Omnitrophota bacterium]
MRKQNAAGNTKTPSAGDGHRKKRRIVFALLCLSLFGSAILYYRVSILRAMASFLIYESETQPCAVVVMLGGGRTERIEKAIELYQHGWAKEILLMIPRQVGAEVIYSELFNNESRMCRAILELRGVADEHVQWASEPFYSTYDELHYLKSWMRGRGVPSAVIVPGLFQSRRAKWTMDRIFRDTDFTLRIIPAAGRFVSAADWWTHEEGMIEVENEYLKNVYYLTMRMIRD